MATQHGNRYLPLDQRADNAKVDVRERLQAGETISYYDVQAIDDMRWDELGKELNIVEVHGTGYRLGKASKYEIREEMGTSKVIEADSMDEAREEATQWAQSGSYESPGTVKVYVTELTGAAYQPHDVIEVAVGT